MIMTSYYITLRYSDSTRAITAGQRIHAAVQAAGYECEYVIHDMGPMQDLCIDVAAGNLYNTVNIDRLIFRESMNGRLTRHVYV